MVINSNLSAQTSSRLLGESSRLLSKSLSRLSSGSRIAAPEDDVANLAVSTRLDSVINRNRAVQNNLSNALSFAQTQDGFLKKIGKCLDRMGELAMLALDSAKSDGDRTLYNQEFQGLREYVNDLETKDFNGIRLFSSTSTFAVATDSDGTALEMTSIGAGYLGATTVATPTPPPTSTQLSALCPHLGDGTLYVSNDAGVPLFSHTFAGTDTLQDFLDFMNGTGGVVSASYDNSTGSLSLTLAPKVGPRTYIDQPLGSKMLEDLGFTTSVFGINNFTSSPLTTSASLSVSLPSAPSGGSTDLSTLSGAAASLTTVRSALSLLATDRAKVGATLARLNANADQLSTLNVNLTAANSRIKDADVAEESTQFARSNILVQVGTAMLAQANSAPSAVLRLLN